MTKLIAKQAAKLPAKTVLAPMLLGTVLLCGGFSSCGGPLNGNTGFDLWCGESMCTWQLEQGQVARMETWHEKDLGVELIGPAVAISQAIEIADVAGCLGLDLLSSLDADSAMQVTVEADFGDDGSVEWSRPLLFERAPEWAAEAFTIPLPAESYDTVRLRIRKDGEGRAALAQIALWDNCNL